MVTGLGQGFGLSDFFLEAVSNSWPAKNGHWLVQTALKLPAKSFFRTHLDGPEDPFSFEAS